MRRANFSIRFLAFLMAFLMLLTGCYSSTSIVSNPDGANLYLNGKYVGQTPYRYGDTKIIASNTDVRLEKEGYNTLYTSFSRNERVNVGAIVGGLFLFGIPFFWALGYKSYHQYELSLLQKAPVTTTQAKKDASPAKGNASDELMKELTGSATEKLRSLKDMFKKGLISKEVYDAQRAKILENP
ncbi:MAG: PEGA domain-containing protein [Tannerellaceae bacterium]|jgi:hypothetical protein|nr:PEGA domain-containing protein [Tannerellaceae bacterium]